MSKITAQSDQTKYYKAQKAAFTKLKSLKEFDYVIGYWEFEAETAMSNLSNPKQQDIAYWQARYNTAVWFLNFIDNITSPDPAGLWDL